MANFLTCLQPEKPRDIDLSHQSLSAFKDGGYREYSLFKQPYNADLQRFSYFYSAKFCVCVPLSTLV